MGQSTTLGERTATIGRDEAPALRWRQAAVLGVLADLFLAPAFGFPIMSRGPNFALFFLVIALGAIMFTVLVWWLRPNHAVHVHKDGLMVVRGDRRQEIRYLDAGRIRYEPRRRLLRIGEDLALRIGRAQGGAVMRAVAAQLQT